MKNYLFVFPLFFVTIVCAQISEPTMPRSRSIGDENSSLSAREENSIYELPYLDNDAERENAIRVKNQKCGDCRMEYYGKGLPVSINLKSAGKKIELKDGNIWILRMRLPKAKGFQLHFSEFDLPQGATLHIYSDKSKFQLGAFTSRNNHPDKRFATSIFPEEEGIIEYYEPVGAPFKGAVVINRVVHVFKLMESVERDASDPGYNKSGSCTVNINCPSGTIVDAESKAVTMMSYYDNRSGYSAFCTGFLINSTNDIASKRPLLLTAGHCISNYVSGYYYDFIFYFDYENPTCANELLSPLYNAKSLQGAYVRTANTYKAPYYSNADYALLELFDKPERYTQVSYLGWDRRKVSQPGAAYNIGHPAGDAKKLATASNPVSTPRLTNGSCFDYPLEAWQLSWNSGVTQDGSSGSPLLNNARQVIGVLHGGVSRCIDSRPDTDCGITSASPGPDFFGRMDYIWDHPIGPPFPVTFPPLSSFLDETATLKTTVSTYVPPAPPTGGGGGGGSGCGRLEGDGLGIKISLPDTKESRFGYSSAIHGNYIIVGAPDASKAYIYKIENCDVKLKAELSPDFDEANFGRSVAIFGDYAIVGEYKYNTYGGAAYVFKRTGESWVRVSKFISGESGITSFGAAVSMSNDYLVIGAPNEYGGAGTIYVFKKDVNGTWGAPSRILSPFPTGGQFGLAVDIYNDRIVVGAPAKDNAGGISIYKLQNVSGSMLFVNEDNFEFSGPAGCDAGADVEIYGNEILLTGGICAEVHSLKYNGTTWVDNGKLISPSPSAHKYGSSVIFNGNYAIVGDNGPDYTYYGSAHIFTKASDGSWTFLKQIQADYARPGDNYGYSMGLTDTHLVVGIPETAINSPGGCNWSGSAIVYELNSVVNSDVNVCTASITGNSTVAARRVTLGGTSSCSVVFQPSSTTVYTANSIQLLQGFKASSGSSFRATAVGCPNFNNGNLNPARLAGNEDAVNFDGYNEVASSDRFELTEIDPLPESDQYLSLYPNPTFNGSFTVKSFLGEIQSVDVYDLEGKLIDQVKFQYETKKIVQVNLPERSEIVVVKTVIDNKVYVKKVSVKGR